MTKEEIENEASNYFTKNFGGVLSKELTDRFVDFAKHIADKAIAAEREDCAKVCDDQITEPECPERAQYCADAIRERTNNQIQL